MKCAIIKDLLPIYCDGLASDETREEVEKHIAECGDCKSVYENMKSAVTEIPKPDIQPM
ncbi:MAG: zf-HC2 domain-containing protein, partial [Ruminococcus sp.]|nr:zf-HC2 domain-containing protein [Ruminococcus sp.]